MSVLACMCYCLTKKKVVFVAIISTNTYRRAPFLRATNIVKRAKAIFRGNYFGGLIFQDGPPLIWLWLILAYYVIFWWNNFRVKQKIRENCGPWKKGTLQYGLQKLLICERKPSNSNHRYAVTVLKDVIVVGHLLRQLSSILSLFILRNCAIDCIITGGRRYSADLP